MTTTTKTLADALVALSPVDAGPAPTAQRPAKPAPILVVAEENQVNPNPRHGSVAQKSAATGKTVQKIADDEWFAPSSSGGAGHKVLLRTMQKTSGSYLVCSCPGGRFAWTKGGAGCWAMKAVRELEGMAL